VLDNTPIIPEPIVITNNEIPSQFFYFQTQSHTLTQVPSRLKYGALVTTITVRTDHSKVTPEQIQRMQVMRTYRVESREISCEISVSQRYSTTIGYALITDATSRTKLERQSDLDYLL
tara:strand:+ start:480 stop:833 length:354 start_codon:yes stop_codon:yes gene_type:complete